MCYLRRRAALLPAMLLYAIFQTQCFAVELRYTWMLPKTVIETTIVYTFQDCDSGSAKIKIAPTLVSRTLPDLRVGQKSLAPESLQSFSQDKGISLQTFSGSRILNSIGSQPASQTGPIIGNILGGVAKVVAVALGVPPVAAAPGGPPVVPPPTCASGSDSGSGVVKQIEDLKAKIKNFQKELSAGADDATQKKDTAAIQAAQNLITTLQDQLTITVKAAIDPGISPVDLDTSDAISVQKENKDGQVANSGLVAKICPSRSQLEKAKWFGNLDQTFANGRTACEAMPPLQISVYLDFPNGHSTMYSTDHQGPYAQTLVSEGDQYRDVAYIPVLVWRGEKTLNDPPKDKDGLVMGQVLLLPPQTMPFGQFGVSQQLPLSVEAFRLINWAVTFLEDGQITNATFSSKAWGLGVTNLFGSAASAANSIVTEERNATSLSTQATTIQAQADFIYQTQRLEICQTHPTNCPSK
jgi:hypothetical protein